MDPEEKVVPPISTAMNPVHGVSTVAVSNPAIEFKSITVTLDEEKSITHDERPAAFGPLWKEIVIVGLCCCGSITQVRLQNQSPSIKNRILSQLKANVGLDVSSQFGIGRFVDGGTRL
jgi:hypothetical protein